MYLSSIVHELTAKCKKNATWLVHYSKVQWRADSQSSTKVLHSRKNVTDKRGREKMRKQQKSAPSTQLKTVVRLQRLIFCVVVLRCSESKSRDRVLLYGRGSVNMAYVSVQYLAGTYDWCSEGYDCVKTRGALIETF